MLDDVIKTVDDIWVGISKHPAMLTKEERFEVMCNQGMAFLPEEEIRKALKWMNGYCDIAIHNLDGDFSFKRRECRECMLDFGKAVGYEEKIR
jgi:hypothetical protein